MSPALARDITEFIDEIGLDAAGDVDRAAASPITPPARSSTARSSTLCRCRCWSRRAINILPIPEGHLCCGSAGTYNLLEPELSGQLRERKLANIAKVEPDVIVTANIGCMMQLQGGTSAPFVHTIEMLDWATGGPAPEALGPLKDSGHPIEALVELAKQTALVD